MLGLDLDSTFRDLPPLCLSMLRGISEQDQKQLAADVNALTQQNLRDEFKLISLGSILLNLVGESVLRSAVGAFKELQPEPDRAPTPGPEGPIEARKLPASGV